MAVLKEEHYITSNDIALQAGVSVRTIKSEIKLINELLKTYDFYVESKTGLGYRMSTRGCKPIPDMNYFLEDLEYDTIFKGDQSLEGRVRYIAIRLLDSAAYIKSECLADELFISASTLSHDLKQVKYIFQNFHIHIRSRPYKGLIAVGEEIDIRNCIDFLYFKNHRYETEGLPIYGEDTIPIIQKMFHTLSNITDRYRLQYPSYSLHDIAVQTFIACQRTKKGCVLKQFTYPNSTTAHEITQEYAAEIENQWGMTMPTAEMQRLECMIDTLYVVDEMHSYEAEHKRILNDTFCEINALFGFDFEEEFTLKAALMQHMKQLVKRCCHHVLIDNPLADRVLSDYLLSVDFANVLARKLQDHYHFMISSDEFSYLVLYFNVTAYASSRMKDKSLYIYCPTSRAEEQIIREEVTHLFKEIVHKIVAVSKEDLEKMHYNGLDLLLTSSDLPACVPAYVQRVPVDFNHKMEFISNILIALNKQIEGYFNIDELLNKDFFVVNPAISSKDEYFEFLFDHLCESMMMDYGEAEYLYERVEPFGQEVGNHIVFMRSQNKFVMPFMHITFVKDMFYWNSDYVKMMIFINFGDSSVEFREFVYQRFKRFFADKSLVDRIFKTMDFDFFMKEIMRKD